MTALHHVYVTAHGEWTNSAWVGEYAQIGIRLGVENEGSSPAKGSVFTPYSGHGDVVSASGTTTGAHGTLSNTWTARLGASGSEENADGAWQTDLAEDVWAFLNSAKFYQSDGFRWTHVRIAPILADGKYGMPASVYTFSAALVGGRSGSFLPPEVALACSFRAAVIGRKGRGRFYFPAISTQYVDTSGMADSTMRTALLGFITTLVTNLENAPGTEVFSPLLMVTSAGASTAVRPAEARIGNHYDVQRRRQAQIAETYAVATL